MTGSVDAFLEALGRSVDDRSAPALDEALEGAIAAGRAAWPDVQVDERGFVQHIARSLGHVLPPGPPVADALAAAVVSLAAGDLWLAFACASGSARAAELFNLRFLSGLPSWIRDLDPSASFADEVVQQLRLHLLVGAGDRAPRIGSYAGQGSLASWTRISARRIAVTLLRRSRASRAVTAETVHERPLPGRADPELEYIKDRYRPEFERALELALGVLTDRERAVLRLNIVSGLTLDRVAAIYQVDKSTVSRWAARARETLLNETRKAVAAKLGIPETEFDSMSRLVLSRMDITLSELLKSR